MGDSSINCYICDCQTDQNPKNVFIQVSRYTGTPVCKILEKLIGDVNLSDCQQIDQRVMLLCHNCLAKIDEYDLAVVTAERVETELKELFTMTVNKMSSTDYPEHSTESKVILKREVIGIVVQNEQTKEQPEDSIEYEEIDELIDNISDTEPIKDDEESLTERYSSDESSTKLKEKRKRGRPRKQEHREQNLSVHCLQSPSGEKKTKQKSGKNVRKTSESTGHSSSLFCDKCGQDFANKTELKTHMKTQHESLDKQVCDICGQTYKSKAALLIHVGLHQGKSPHECEMCGKRFTQKGALVRHMPIHTGERPYQCDKCGKQFIHYSSFHMHQLAHDNIREKKCSICGLELRSNSHLTRHMRVHSGEKPYSCPTCGQKFAQRYNMMTHYKAHQGIHRVTAKSHVCPICHIGFAKPGKLNEHLANQHNTCTSTLAAAASGTALVASESVKQQQTISSTTSPNVTEQLSHSTIQTNNLKNINTGNIVGVGMITNFLLRDTELMEIKKETFLDGNL